MAGCAISIFDVLLILLFYRPNGSMKGLRAFEFFVVALVLGVVICFCIQLSLIKDTSVGEVFRGYLPSSAIVESNGYGVIIFSFTSIQFIFANLIKSLSSMRHSRCDGHASQLVSRLGNCPTPPFRVLHQEWACRSPRPRARHFRPSSYFHREIHIPAFPLCHPILSQLLHCRARHFSVHLRSLRQLRYPDRCRRLPVFSTRCCRRVSFLYPQSSRKFTVSGSRHHLRSGSASQRRLCRNCMHDRRADGQRRRSELDYFSVDEETDYSEYQYHPINHHCRRCWTGRVTGSPERESGCTLSSATICERAVDIFYLSKSVHDGQRISREYVHT